MGTLRYQPSASGPELNPCPSSDRIRGSGRYPAIDRWFEALETRPTYLGQKSDFYTHCQ